MLFRSFFYSTLWGTIVSAIIGVIMAYMNFGVWALVVQYMTNTITDTVVLCFTIKWKPKKVFSFQRLRVLYSYGWKLLCASLLSSAYLELTGLFIGKVYGSTDLAYYNQGKKIPQIVVSQINSSIDTVLFPAMSKHQNDLNKLREDIRYSIRFASFCLFPLLLVIVAIANDLVFLLLTEKWYPSVFFIQISCISYMTLPINIANIQVIKALGRSDIYLKLDILKKIIGFSMLLFFLRKGVIAIAIADAVSNYVGLIINAYPNIKLINYKLKDMLLDIVPNLLLSIIMLLFVHMVGCIINISIFFKLIIQVTFGICLYICLAKFLKFDILFEMVNLFLGYIRKN